MFCYRCNLFTWFFSSCCNYIDNIYTLFLVIDAVYLYCTCVFAGFGIIYLLLFG
nr:MAG TPA: hypothetical protein [Bacteriophage sp.]DAN49507.1 MAG TPA: hypothetical protein [Caudoviricetes sp.]DAZ68513.1 MAG TPA: hypothetical protein [Caudoviricetes sp.]